ncbi:FecR family protein [Marispirochaeta aestuarii]|uniref:FecR family protein n=1 Tax=Marispirochaeta aestuarii TaxID=1963862 RepID=UPI002ABE6EF1|nr:FecR family protein [Marispirochaeta aestuarii]
MRKPSAYTLLFTLGLFFTAALPSAAQVASIDYLQGWVDLRYPSGDVVEAMIGDELEKDDTVITGEDGTATLARQGAAEIVINPNTVFSIREIDSGGQKETVMHTALGSVKFKFLRLFGIEPKISTPSTVAGVRGTEFTVYAGDEGSALFTVDSGEVMVTSQGIPVVLYEGEGVEVKAGRPPGEKFEKKGRPIDYSQWAQEKQAEFSADPIAGLRGIERQMDGYVREVENVQIMLEEQNAITEKLRNEWNSLKESGDKESAQSFFDETYTPEIQRGSAIYHNLRYFVLNAFSLKRYVVSKQYTLLKAKKLIGSASSQDIEALNILKILNENFQRNIITFLDPNDI